MTWTHWMLFMAAEIVLCVLPGPAVLFVVAQALRHGGRRSLWASGGILTGNAFYFLLSATGLGALIATSHTLFLVVKFAGAAYLFILGVRLWRSAGTATLLPTAAGSERSTAVPPAPALFRRGFVLEAANPKALIYFTALLPQFIDPRQPVAMQVFILGVSSIAAESIVLAGYGLLAGRATHLAAEPRFSKIADRAAGTLLIGAGAGLLAAGEG